MSTFDLHPSWIDESERPAQGSRHPIASAAGPSHIKSFGPLWDRRLSPWSRSTLKRTFDLVCVFCSLPVLAPVFLVVGLAVRLTSAGPVLFLQKRVGRHGRLFTILKFRTMKRSGTPHQAVTTAGNQRFTSIGLFLRRWKLDELPQLWNVLAGQMSLVGPRPKLPEHEPCLLPCRPGITGAATAAFAREEIELDRVPKDALDDFYNNVVLPAKRKLDIQYMARATFRSDLRLLVDTVLRHWDTDTMRRLLRGPQVALEWHGDSQPQPVVARKVRILDRFVSGVKKSAAAD